MIEIRDNRLYKIPHKTMKFPGGEIHVRIEGCNDEEESLFVTAFIQNSDDVMELLLVTDAIDRQWPGVPRELVLPYLPYARQDRVAVPGEALSLKVFANLINSLNYKTVVVWDCHSDVGLALLDNVCHVPQYMLIDGYQETLKFIPNNAVFISPDAGARKKIFKAAEELAVSRVICADKKRDVVTGKITDTVVQVPDEYKGKGYDFFVLDDICDGARTFIELGKALREQIPDERLSLVVTHGIFSNEENYKTLESLYNLIFTFNDFRKTK